MTPTQKPRVFFVDDEADLAASLAIRYARDYETEAFTSSVDALRSVDDTVAVVVADHRMPEMDGTELLTKSLVKSPETARVLLTAVGELVPRPALVGAHLFDYLSKDPLGSDRLGIVLAKAVESNREYQRQKRELADLKALVRMQIGEERLFEDLLGNDSQLLEAIRLGRRASSHKRPVLITGETGTGKDWLARAIHFHGERKRAPFKSENCATYTRDLAQALLFGEEKGAFTGSRGVATKGLFREMEGGTVFLDEIGLLHIGVQGFLLRFLDNGNIHPLGYSGKQNLKADDVRIIAATDRDLGAAIQKGEFMPALFQRLDGNHAIHLPPLRERRGDIPILVKHAQIVASSTRARGTVLMSASAMSYLQGLPYPGNIRELNLTIVAAIEWMEEDCSHTIELDHVQAAVQMQEAEPGQPLNFRDAVNAFKKQFVEGALKRHKHKSDAAKELGMTARNLLMLTKALGISTEK